MWLPFLVLQRSCSILPEKKEEKKRLGYTWDQCVCFVCRRLVVASAKRLIPTWTFLPDACNPIYANMGSFQLAQIRSTVTFCHRPRKMQVSFTGNSRVGMIGEVYLFLGQSHDNPSTCPGRPLSLCPNTAGSDTCAPSPRRGKNPEDRRHYRNQIYVHVKACLMKQYNVGKQSNFAFRLRYRHEQYHKFITIKRHFG